MTNHTEDELEQLKDELKKAEAERDKYKEGFLIVCRWIDTNSKMKKEYHLLTESKSKYHKDWKNV